MPALDALVREAASLGAGRAAVADADTGEVARQLRICNACRYCEGFCAVFPAMTRRLEFPPADVHYLANLCHHCGACLHACQYAPPHEFAVNLPRAMARVRRRTYAHYAWPAAFGRAYERNGLVVAGALAAGLALLLVMVLARHGTLWGAADGDFYAVLPHGTMVALFAPVFLFAVLALGVGVVRFWREAGPSGAVPAAAAAEATHDALRLRYLDGGHGDGCNEADDRFTHARRHAHHLTFWGFVLCFAATVTGTVYHYAFGWLAPYGWTSLPKLLGTAGGVLLVAGTAALWRLRRARHPQQQEPANAAMDLGLIALLFLAGATGLALALARGTAAMPLLLAVHLGAVLALFATMPYGKFAHGVYRGAALLKWSVERRRPLALKLGSE